MKKEQLTIKTALQASNIQIFAKRKFIVNGHTSMGTGPNRGFTLVEMMVSLGLFTIVMFIATSSFLSIVNSDRKARSVRIAADNLNIALEDMSRRIKTGTEYYCGPGGEALGLVKDCAVGTSSDTVFFTGQDGKRVKYSPDSVGGILRSVGIDAPILVTSTEINITDLKFFVTGSSSADTKQPIVVIVIKGSLGAGTAMSSFKIQTTVTQRQYDN